MTDAESSVSKAGPQDGGLSHVQADGTFRMVDVSDKAVTVRHAVARGAIRMRAETLQAIRQNTLAKGDVLPVARLAGVLAAKRTSDLIPLCHPLPLSGIDVVVTFDDSLPGVVVEGSVTTAAQTGVEMEALTAVSVALLTVYDMAKAVDRTMEITGITLREKRGGRSGSWPPGS
ncbi:MAG: cyclic pyranopterin monophosphate synthase MoaC [Gemmatimonadetes bacterium]|nr:cyclic pyranopterin monophosphate synthase MoaC [Gemmatimonadota bacterium]